MIESYPLPKNEVERLKALYRYKILDTPPEEGFDEIVKLICEICEVPIALVSLMDIERQWFKSKIGLNVNETSRCVSFCAHTIEHPAEVMIVQDATKDDRFANNPLVTSDPNIRFYAGTPLITPEGYKIGTLCIIDTVSRQLTKIQVNALLILSKQIINLIELRTKVVAFKKVNEDLYLSELRYRILCDDSPLGIFKTDTKGNLLYVNNRYLELSGLTEKECYEYGWNKNIHPIDKARVHLDWYTTVEAGKNYDCIHRYIKGENSVFWYRIKASPIKLNKYEDANIIGYVGVVDDVTIEVEKNRVLQDKESRLDLALQGAELGSWEWNLRTGKIIFNSRFATMLGYAPEEMTPTISFLRNLIHPDDKSKVDEILELYLSHNLSIYEVECRFLTKSGDWRWILERAKLFEYEDQVIGPYKMVGTHLDIHEKKIQAEQLQRALLVAKTATEAKSQFLSNMSHEIRTPLTSIIGFAEIAKEQGHTEEERIKALEIIFNNGNHLLDIINNILDLSKIDAGAITIENIKFDFLNIIQDVTEMIIPKAKDKNLALEIVYNWPLPETITSDPLRLKQVLINLISNAIKFTPSGTIKVIISCDEKNEFLNFSILDTGIGIPEAQIPKLFNAFTQADPSTTRQYGGTGLGLVICKDFIQKLGGDGISIQSIVGEGSTFSFNIRTGSLKNCLWTSQIKHVSHELKKEEHNPNILLNGKILIADDAKDNQKILLYTLKNTGLDITFSDNGEEALKAGISEKFDLILMDMQMPVMDGYTATQELRKNGSTVPIIAFTASTMVQDIIKCIDAGCNSHISKPFHKEELFRILSTYLKDPIYPTCIQNDSLITNSQAIISEKFNEDKGMIDLIIDFVDSMIEVIQDLKDNKYNSLVTPNEFKALTNISHSLAGSSGLYGYSEISQICIRLENASKNSELAECRNLIDKLSSVTVFIKEGIEIMKQSL